MGKVNDGVLKKWYDGEVVTAAVYEQEREILRAANNDNHNRILSNEGGLNALDTRTAVLEEANESNALEIASINEAIPQKANKADVYTKEELYTKTDLYTKTEVNAKLSLGNTEIVDGGSFLDTYSSQTASIDGGEF